MTGNTEVVWTSTEERCLVYWEKDASIKGGFWMW